MTERHASAFTVPASHPSLPGHFPGSPVVPGVVVLDHVLKATEQWRGRAVSASGLKQVKFHAPLLPDEPADVAFELEGDALRFQVTRGGQLVAQGTFVLAAARSSSPPTVGPESTPAATPDSTSAGTPGSVPLP